MQLTLNRMLSMVSASYLARPCAEYIGQENSRLCFLVDNCNLNTTELKMNDQKLVNIIKCEKLYITVERADVFCG